MALTGGKLKAVELPTLAKKAGMHHDGGGLYLRVAKPTTEGKDPTAASWVLRYMLDLKPRTMGLGPYPEIKLAEARELALDAKRLKARGQDPIAAREADKAARKAAEVKPMTFKQCAQAYIRSHSAGWKNAKHAQQWGNTLEAYAYPIIGQTPIALIDNAAVLRVLQQEVEETVGGKIVEKRLWEAKPETASRLRGRLEAILGWAIAGGFRAGDNPARWKGQLEHQLPARGKVARVEHHAALPYPDIADFMRALRKQEGLSARALEFAILTATRTSEVLGARWDEIDLEAKVWTIPARRMKAGREHRVPLSRAAVAVLEALIKPEDAEGALVFPGAKPGKPLSNMAFLMLLRRMKREDLTAHGFRSTFRDWCGEETATPREVAEAALAHTVADKTEAAYARGDLFAKRVTLMEAWARTCNGEGGDNILAFPAASAA